MARRDRAMFKPSVRRFGPPAPEDITNHPTTISCSSIVQTQCLHAAIFHDDLISYEELVDRYRSSHMLTVYFWGSLDEAFSDLGQHMLPFLRRGLYWCESTVWIRHSTGRPCIEFTHSDANSACLSILTPPNRPVHPYVQLQLDSVASKSCQLAKTAPLIWPQLEF
ncbi:hypothetical protein DFH06DRAFT_58389 [Mycena polygramma]|nr:hypothetical protein DFH06DRAFT_58389 [Mycena polygramma]